MTLWWIYSCIELRKALKLWCESTFGARILMKPNGAYFYSDIYITSMIQEWHLFVRVVSELRGSGGHIALESSNDRANEPWSHSHHLPALTLKYDSAGARSAAVFARRKYSSVNDD